MDLENIVKTYSRTKRISLFRVLIVYSIISILRGKEGSTKDVLRGRKLLAEVKSYEVQSLMIISGDVL